MRIYYASQSFYPHIGGVSTYLLNLCKEMVKKGNGVVEVHLRPSGEESEAEIRGIEIHRVPREPIDKKIMKGYSKFKESVYTECHYDKNTFAKPPAEMEGYEEYNIIQEYFGEELKNLLEEDPADIVHIHDFQLLFAYRYVPRGTPLILTWHIPFIEDMTKHLSRFLIKHFKEYDKVVFSSQDYIEAAVKAGFPREKTELIHPMANTRIFRKLDVDRKAIRKRYNLPADAKIILCVQRVDPKSGHEQLIKAMPQVLKKVPNAKLVFVGGESLSSKLSKSREALRKKVLQLIKELKLEKHVIFTGTIDYYELPKLYNSVDLVTLCSKNEGFGLAVTEGMACGNPIVGTKVGGIPIQVKDGENGFLVEVGDVKATSNAMIKVLTDDKLRKKMSQNSLRIVDKNFKIDVGVEKHLMLYNSVKRIKDEFHKIEYMDLDDIRAIITDLDRTITDKAAKKEFDEKDFDEKLLKELKSLGIDLILSTGRVVHYIKRLCERFKIWRAVVAENGAVIYFPSTRKTITINTSAMTKAKKIVKSLNLPGTTIGKVITSNRWEDKDLIIEKLGKLAKKVNFVKNVDELMVVPKGVDKGVGLRLAMQYLNIDMDKSIAVGDGENDIDMFLNPGFKIALANADEKLKRFANQITKYPSTKGIREIIKKLRM
ncbi:glycosyltransferase [Candidatus Woesearchaeota archaeon]|nr:glycosyltransferase [Candidatus Woesearchaeota archaeon]